MDFLLVFAGQEFEDFREAEFHSLLDLSQVNFDRKSIENHNWENNFLVVNLSSYEDVNKLIKRSILIKCAYRIWARAKTLESICEKIGSFSDEFTQDMNERKLTYRLNIEAMHKKYKINEKIQVIETILESHKQLIMTQLKLTNPDIELGLFIDFPYDKVKGCVSTDHPNDIFYGKLASYSDRLKIAAKYKLSERKFIGNTSLDVKLSFMMANLGRVVDHQLVFDPFVGTGSILVAAAHHGARVFGADIDYKVIYGVGKSTRADQIWRAEDECLRLNFQQYGLESNYMDIFVGDSSRMDKILRPSFKFDAILTDPPYGIRERSRKLMSCEQRPYMNDKTVPHFPQKETYQIFSVFDDLLALTSKRINIGGYLAMWYPLIREKYTGVDCLPTHASLELIHNCEQILNDRTSRRLLVYKKISDEIDVSFGNGCENSSIRKTYFNSQ